MNFPILIKNMMLFLLTWGIGFVVGSYCGYKGAMEDGLEGWTEEVDLEEWL